MSLLEAMGTSEERLWLHLGLGRAGISGTCVQTVRTHPCSDHVNHGTQGWDGLWERGKCHECGQCAKGCVQPAFHMRARRRRVPSLPQESGEAEPVASQAWPSGRRGGTRLLLLLAWDPLSPQPLLSGGADPGSQLT